MRLMLGDVELVSARQTDRNPSCRACGRYGQRMRGSSVRQPDARSRERQEPGGGFGRDAGASPPTGQSYAFSLPSRRGGSRGRAGVVRCQLTPFLNSPTLGPSDRGVRQMLGLKRIGDDEDEQRLTPPDQTWRLLSYLALPLHAPPNLVNAALGQFLFRQLAPVPGVTKHSARTRCSPCLTDCRAPKYSSRGWRTLGSRRRS